MKRFLCSLLVLCSLLALALITGCEEEEETAPTTAHSHAYGNEWLCATEGHYRECTCHPDVKELQDHFDVSDKDGLCDFCGFTIKEKKTYTVTLLDSTGAPVMGATVRVSSTTTSFDKTTDENGSVAVEFVYADSLNVFVASLPEGYSFTQVKTYKLTSTSLTINDIIKEDSNLY